MMKNKQLTIVLAALACLPLLRAEDNPLATKAYGVEGDFEFNTGKVEVDGGGESDVSEMDITARFGVLLADGLVEVGPTVGYSRNEQDDNETSSLELGGYADFNFNVAPAVYLGPSLFATYNMNEFSGDVDAKGFGLNPNVFAKLFVGDTAAAVIVRLGYGFQKLKTDDVDVDITGFTSNVGFGYYF